MYTTRKITLTVDERFAASVQEQGIKQEQMYRAIGYAATWAALHTDHDSQLLLSLNHDGELSCGYRNAAGEPYFFMAGIPRPQDESGYSFHS